MNLARRRLHSTPSGCWWKKLVTSWQRSKIDANSIALIPQNLTSQAFRSRTIIGVASCMSLNTGSLSFSNWSSVSCFHSSEMVVVWSEKVVTVDSQTLSFWFSGICWSNLMLVRATRISMDFVSKSGLLNDFQVIWPLTFISQLKGLVDLCKSRRSQNCRISVTWRLFLKEFRSFEKQRTKMTRAENESKITSTDKMSLLAVMVRLAIVVVNRFSGLFMISPQMSKFGGAANVGVHNKRMTSKLIHFPKSWARRMKDKSKKLTPHAIETTVSQIVVNLSIFDELMEFWSMVLNLAKIASVEVAKTCWCSAACMRRRP